VIKHFDAYADIAWDDPAFALDLDDPRLELSPDDPLGATAWYRSQPQPVRARLGVHMIATFTRIGYGFESILNRGLLEFAYRLPLDAPEFATPIRSSESQHSLMFPVHAHEAQRRPRFSTWRVSCHPFARRFPESSSCSSQRRGSHRLGQRAAARAYCIR
jgi:hypothetical protein